MGLRPRVFGAGQVGNEHQVGEPGLVDNSLICSVVWKNTQTLRGVRRQAG